MRKKTYDSLRITVPNTTTAGIRNFTKTLDPGYGRCKSVGLVITSNGGDATFKAGLRSNTGGEIIPMVNNALLAFNANIQANERLLEVDFESRNETVTVSIENRVTLTSDLEIELIFELVNEEA